MRFPTLYISHGGGPWPWIPEMAQGAYAELGRSLQALPQHVGARPDAVLMVSAHWEEPEFTVQGAERPEMIYDYYGFPEHTYRIRYPASGSPALAQRVLSLLRDSGIAAREDAARGYDHGMYAPMFVAYPGADLPTVQLSLRRGLDPDAHLAAGRALEPLRDEGILIVGSGYSFHNLRLFGPAGYEPSAQFDHWLHETMQRDGAGRASALSRWSGAPGARLSHAREEHLLPLMVAAGAAEADEAHRIYHEERFLGGVHVSSYRFGDAAT